MRIQHQQLAAFVAAIFERLDTDPTDAATVAEHLVAANLKGHDSHGVGMVPTYVSNIRRGRADVRAHAKVVRDAGAVLLVDGQMGFGQVVGIEAVDLAVARAAGTGVACVGVRNCHHLGRIGSYGERAAEAGFVSIHFVNVVGHQPLVSPFGGRERRMSTNPFCAVVPRSDGPPIVLDMATSAIAQGKARVAYMQGKPVPAGALVDHEGRPTTNAAVMFEAPLGALSPFGLHKGYGLALICELLGGGLAGEWTAAQPADHPQGSTIVNHMLMLVVDPNVFGGSQAFAKEVSAMVAELHATTPATGVDRVMVPGEPELAAFDERGATGIPIDANTWAGIVEAAEVVGMSRTDIPTDAP